MKKTEMDRIERELKRKEKKDNSIADSGTKSGSIADYINQLHAVFLFDHESIFNINSEEKILDLLEDIKANLPEKKWDDVLNKAIKKTGIKNKSKAYDELQGMMH